MKKTVSSKIRLFLTVSVIFWCFACATQNMPKTSGFLEDYSKLKETPFADAKGAYSYFNPNKPLSQYSRFIILPVQVRPLAGNSVLYKKNREVFQKAADYFYYQLKKNLSKSDYAVVHEPGPETLLLRTAITNLDPARPIARMRSSKMILEEEFWGGVSAEAELIDALTGEVVVAVVDSQKGRRYDKITRFGNIKEVIERWSKRLITRMDEAHHKAP